MKTKSKANIKAMSELFKLRAKIKELQTQEKIIKENIMASMSENLLEGGGYMVVITDAQRSQLDKKQMIKDMGQKFVDEYTKTTFYKKLEVKEVA